MPACCLRRFLSIYFYRFLSVDRFAGLLDPDYILGPIVEGSSFIYLFHLSLRQRFALIFMKEHLSQVVRCAPNFAYSDPDLDR